MVCTCVGFAVDRFPASPGGFWVVDLTGKNLCSVVHYSPVQVCV